MILFLSFRKSNIASFNFKLLHLLLVTRQTLHQFNANLVPTCSICDDEVAEDLEHALISCNYNNGVGLFLLRVINEYIPVSPTNSQALLCLDLPGLEEELELPIITFVSSILLDIWESRLSNSRITLFDTRTNLEARCSLLRETRFNEAVPKLTELIKNLEAVVN